MWLIDFVVMAPGGSICLISEKIIDINIKMSLPFDVCTQVMARITWIIVLDKSHALTQEST